MKTGSPFLSIVFCTNRAEHLQDFASGLLELSQQLPAMPMELLVICPDSTAIRNQIQNLKTILRVRVLEEPWGNRSQARNQGFATAMGEWIYFVDQDIRIDLRRLSEVARSLENLAIYGQNIHMVSGPYVSDRNCTFWGDCYNWLSNLWLLHPKNGLRALAGNVLLRKSAFVTLPFDPALASGGEEIELCHRIQKQNGRGLIDPNLAIVHHADHTFLRFWRRLTTHARAKRLSRSPEKHTSFDFALLQELSSFPSRWVAIIIWAAAHLWETI